MSERSRISTPARSVTNISKPSQGGHSANRVYRAELERIWPYEQVDRPVVRLRMDYGLSQRALAERVRTMKSRISCLETGQHT